MPKRETKIPVVKPTFKRPKLRQRKVTNPNNNNLPEAIKRQRRREFVNDILGFKPKSVQIVITAPNTQSLNNLMRGLNLESTRTHTSVNNLATLLSKSTISNGRRNRYSLNDLSSTFGKCSIK